MRCQYLIVLVVFNTAVIGNRTCRSSWVTVKGKRENLSFHQHGSHGTGRCGGQRLSVMLAKFVTRADQPRGSRDRSELTDEDSISDMTGRHRKKETMTFGLVRGFEDLGRPDPVLFGERSRLQINGADFIQCTACSQLRRVEPLSGCFGTGRYRVVWSTITFSPD